MQTRAGTWLDALPPCHHNHLGLFDTPEAYLYHYEDGHRSSSSRRFQQAILLLLKLRRPSSLHQSCTSGSTSFTHTTPSTTSSPLPATSVGFADSDGGRDTLTDYDSLIVICWDREQLGAAQPATLRTRSVRAAPWAQSWGTRRRTTA